MEAFKTYTSTIVPIISDNIDTDIIIPKNYLKSISKTGFGDFAFDPWRYDENRNPIADFPLNQTQYKNAGILLTGDNFGCGSSREHAAWALQDAGIRVVIAGSYSDIFYNNWLNNGHLPIVQSKAVRDELAQLSADEAVTIDLENLKIVAKGKEYPFELSENWRYRLMNGLDTIGLTLKHEAEIAAYEQRND